MTQNKYRRPKLTQNLTLVLKMPQHYMNYVTE